MRILILDFWGILKLPTKGSFIRSKTAGCSNNKGSRLRRVRTTILPRFIFQGRKELYELCADTFVVNRMYHNNSYTKVEIEGLEKWY